MEAAAAAARSAPPAAAPVPEQKPDAQVVPNSIPVEGQAAATTSSTNAATQAPVPPAATTPSALRRTTPARPSQIAPGSTAPLEIRPGQRTNRATQGQRAGEANAAERTPIRRWVLDPLFGAQR
jgi:hypothetical protein